MTLRNRNISISSSSHTPLGRERNAMKPPPPKRRRIDTLNSTTTSRPAPKATAVPIPPPPDINERLFYQRAESQNKLKSAWELIFAKYERDTSDYADEIDLETGEIVVDKGHLRGLEGKSGETLGEDLWTNWVDGEDQSDKVEDAEAEGSVNGKKPVCKPKLPKMLVVAGTIYGITDCELCAEQDELDFTACAHGRSISELDEKENTPLAAKEYPQTPSATKNSPRPTSRIEPPVISLEEEDDLSSATPAPQSRPSGLTPVLNILDINTTTSPAPQVPTRLPAKQLQPLPSSPIARHVNRNRPQQLQEPPHSSPPLLSSPQPALPSSSPPRRVQDPWAPLADDPLADKKWHSHHPDGSPPRPRRGLPQFLSGPKPAPPSFQLNTNSVKRGNLRGPPQQLLLKTKRKEEFLQDAEVLIKGGGQEGFMVEEEMYSEDEESDRPTTSVKMPSEPPTGPKKKPTTTKSTPNTKETSTATPSKKCGAASTPTIPSPKLGSVAAPNSGLKTLARTPAEVSANSLTKTPAKTTSKAPAKTPAKTASKTPSKPLSKAPAKTPTPTLWSSQFTGTKKRKRVDNFSGYDSDIQELSDNDRGLGILRYIKSRVKIKPGPVKIEQGKIEKNTFAFYDTPEDDSGGEDNHAVFKQYSLKSSTKATAMSTSETVTSSSRAGAATAKKVPIKQEEEGGEVVGPAKKKNLPTQKPSYANPTTSRGASTTTSTTVNLTDSRLLLLSAIGKICGAKGFNCGKPFCWDCIEAEDDHL